MAVDFSGMSRDIKCAGDVGRMADLGKFNVEFDAYGCTYMTEGKQYYRVSSKGVDIFDFVYESIQKGIYPTSVEHLVYSTVVPVEMREKFSEQTKMKLVRQMKETYQGLFAVLQPLADTEANNESLPYLRQEAEQLEGHFDDMALQRFAGTIQFAYECKILNDTGWQELQQWMERERKQMEDDPVVADRCERTFYGFAYIDETGAVKYFCDAQKLMTQERRQKFALAGNFVCPMMQKKYWFGTVGQMGEVKAQFLKELKELQDQAYIAYLQQLKQLPGVISAAAFAEARETLQEAASAEAVAVLDYYGRMWNRTVTK